MGCTSVTETDPRRVCLVLTCEGGDSFRFGIKRSWEESSTIFLRSQCLLFLWYGSVGVSLDPVSPLRFESTGLWWVPSLPLLSRGESFPLKGRV